MIMRFLIALFFGMTLVVQGKVYADRYCSYKRMVVLVDAINEYNNHKVGAGVIISDLGVIEIGHRTYEILTAAHVVEGAKEVRIYFYPDTSSYHDAIIVDISDTELDAALLQVSPPISEEQPKVQSLLLGAPISTSEHIWHIGHADSKLWRDSSGKVKTLDIAGLPAVFRTDWRSDVEIKVRDSGGPVFNARNQLIGITSKGNDFAEPKRILDIYDWLIKDTKALPNRLISNTTQLHNAAIEGHIDLLNTLLHYTGVDEKIGNTTAFLRAVYAENHDVVMHLYRAGADLTERWRTKSKSHDTAMHIAAWNADVRMVELLLQMKAPFDLKNSRGDTPLNRVASSLSDIGSKLKIIRTLKENGANLHNVNDYGGTALVAAVYSEELGKPHTQLIEYLLENSIDTNAVWGNTDDESISWHTTITHLSAQYGYLDSLELLLQHGAPLNERDSDGYTPLMLLASGERVKSHEGDRYCRNDEDGVSLRARLLIKHGADTTLESDEGLTALEIAENRFDQGQCTLCLIAVLNGRSCRDTWND